MVNFKEWEGFEGSIWKNEVNTRDFIQKNYVPYDGDESFLADPTEATDKLWGELQKLQKEERAKGGVLDMETEVVSGLTAYGPGYINENILIKFLSTNIPSKNHPKIGVTDVKNVSKPILNNLFILFLLFTC